MKHVPRRGFLGRLIGAVGGAVVLLPRRGQAAVEAGRASGVDVRDHGAQGDGVRLNTRELQAAIDACAAAGGGTVHFPAGTYLTGTLFLKSRVTLHLENGAVLLGSKRLEDYPPAIPAIRSYTDNYTERSLIYAENVEHIALKGQGIINGQGAAFKGEYKLRPYLIRVIACRNVLVRDITIKDAPMWVQHYLACDDVNIDGITVRSHCNGNNDGIDIDGCQRVRIANCDISSGDDAIVLKSTLDRPCKDVVVTNCVLSSHCNAFKLGTESNGGFENIMLSNCVMYDTRLSGIALELVDGGRLHHVGISNVTMRDVKSVIFVRLGNRARPFKEGMEKPGMGSLQNISISHVQAAGADRTGCSITGLPGFPAKDITLDDIHITFAGGGKEEQARAEVPEHPERYPEYKMFGTLPAYGFYCRHAQGLQFNNLRLDCIAPDERPGLVCEDVENLEIFGWHATVSSKANPTIRFQEVRNALIHGCSVPEGTAEFLRVGGKGSDKIRLLANDLSAARTPVALGPEVPAKAVSFPAGQ